MPILNIPELNTRHSEFLRDIRNSIRHGDTTDIIQIRIEAAQESYRRWWADKGIEVDFTSKE